MLPMQETLVQSLGWEDPLEECMATHSSILAWRIPMDRGAWWATVHRVTMSEIQLKQLRKDTRLRKDYTDIENKLMVTKGESGRLGLTYTHYYV